MIYLAEATGTQILARGAGIAMSALGAIFLIFFLVMRGVVGEELEQGNLEAAAKVKRNVLIALSIGCLLLGSGAALYFGS
ncbi:hypothetical protein [Streptomyces sp. AcE210]|uniref:hypothetical protein n=1 Tax=Streptomyces sp. AcE210 TaxID=2292703 RepID=UPI000E302765|nr:hypothetical protein [Streptomyces sp. AcE210]RFC71056.1 hypothetical protein DXZ75_28240 [Streptomyces sp. AcE210]